MFGDLAVTFYNNVVEAYDDYASHRDSPSAGRDRHLRTALEIATSLYHFREHLPERLSASAKNLEQNLPDYALLRGVTNASKHNQVTRKHSLVASADDIKEMTVIVRYSDESGEYSHSQTKLNVTCTDGVTRWLDLAITRILNYWGTFLKDEGVCEYDIRPEPEEPGCRYISRDEASTQMNLEAMRGLQFSQSMQFLKFDNSLGRAIPVDLTGAELEFRIYKPPQQLLDIKLSHPEHGDLSATLSLTDQENITFHSIQDQTDHDAFMKTLLKAHRSEIEHKFQEQIIKLQDTK